MCLVKSRTETQRHGERKDLFVVFFLNPKSQFTNFLIHQLTDAKHLRHLSAVFGYRSLLRVESKTYYQIFGLNIFSPLERI